ncbi:MAG: flap structure-specific endonuclease, partial [Halobacteriaceae archaeon]
SKGKPEIMDFEATLEENSISWEQLVDVGILCGTDYNDGLEGFGPKTALSEIKEHGDLWEVLDANDVYIEHADEIRQLFLDPTVTDDYDIQYGLDPDIARAKEYVIKEWEIDADEVERGFERIQESVVQTGLDQWS